MVLVATLLIQILPATAKGAEITEAEPENLTIEAQTGLSDMYEYLTYDEGRAGTIHINTYTGKAHVRRTDMTLSSERMPMEISFYYDETNTEPLNPYGRGWTNIYSQLLIYNSADERYKYKNENGTWIYFKDSGTVNEDGEEIWKEDTVYGIGATGAELYLEAEAETDDYTAARLSQTGMDYYFDSQGRLVKIADEHSYINIAYAEGTNQIEHIEDATGRKFVFYYSNMYLIGIYAVTADEERIENTEVVYRMSLDGILNGVIYGYKDHNTYSYNGDTLVRIADIDNCGYGLAYDSSGRVTSVTQMADMFLDTEEEGAVITLDREKENSLTVTNDTGREKYTFDDCGRTTRFELQHVTKDKSYITVYGYNATYDYYDEEDGTRVNGMVDITYFDMDGIIDDEEDSEETENSGEEEGESTGDSGTTEDGEETGDSETDEGTEATEGTQDSETTEEDAYSTAYDVHGNLIEENVKDGDLQQTTKYTYDTDGNYLLSTTDTDGYIEQYLYGQYSDDLSATVDKNGNRTDYTFNALRDLSLVTMKVSGLKSVDTSTGEAVVTEGEEEISVGYEYEAGRLTSIHYGDSVYVFTYDKWGNLLTVTMDETTLVTYDYGLDNYKGLAKVVTYGTSRSVYYTYDYKDRVSTVGYAENTPRYTYTYTTDSEISSVYDSTLGQVTKYTEDGWQTYKGTPDEVTELLYEYKDSGTDGESYSETILGQAFSYTVENDENFTWIKVLDEAGLSVYQEKSEYDGFDRLKEKPLSIGELNVSQKYSYVTKDGTTGNRVSDYILSYNKGETAENLSFTYAYDGNGNIISVEELDKSSLYKTEYLYDEAGQLKEAYDEKTNTKYCYYYDAYGNIVSEEIYTINNDRTETLKERIINEYDGMVLKKSHSSVSGTTYYRADSCKNVSSISSESKSYALQWTEGRRLTQIRDIKNQRAISYNYNDEGLRTKKIIADGDTSATTEYVWGQNGLAGFTTDEDTVVVYYGQDGTPVGFSLNDTVYTYIKNIQGDVLRILDTTGNTVVEYSYDPWGVPTVTGDAELAAINPCSYRGYDYDEETGFYYLQSRYYDPEVGRFISTDDIGFLRISGTILGYNLYSYCWNNPENMADEKGTLPWFVTAAAIGALSDSILYLVTSAIRGDEVTWSGLVKAAITGAISGVSIGAIGRAIRTAINAGKFAKYGIQIMNKKYANKTFKLTGELAKKYGKGIKFNKYGFPNFRKYAKHTVKVKGLTGNYTKDAAMANAKVGLKSTPKGYTWHHVEDGLTMMLIPTDLHRAVRHTGGAALIKKLLSSI